MLPATSVLRYVAKALKVLVAKVFITITERVKNVIFTFQ